VSKPPVRVVVVEDSLVQRAHLVEALEADGDIRVVGEATTAAEAIDVVARCRPDVVTVDLVIPEGGGQLLIERIMADTPTPILVLSATVTPPPSAVAESAVAAGALVTLAKPRHWTPTDETALRRTVRNLQGVLVIRHPRGRVHAPAAGPAAHHGRGAPVVAIGASTGGPAALATLLGDLGGLAAPVLVVQHLHADFMDSFATWMRRASPLDVVVAEHQMSARQGCVYLAPGGRHLRLGAGHRLLLSTQPETIHRPSADELFHSVAEQAGADAIGVILTGIGDDGAQGLLAIARAGGRTLGQDEASSAVFGMPRAAGALGAVQEFLDPAGLARAIRRRTAEVAS
jgi:two-component system chemotaxis response regulator CheB